MMNTLVYVLGITVFILFISLVGVLALQSSEEIDKEDQEEEETMNNGIYFNADEELKVSMNILNERLQQIITDNKCIQETFSTIEQELIKMRKSNQDTLRIEMNRIYYQYEPYQKITEYDKKAFDHICEDYKDIKGNSYVEKMEGIINKWEVVKSKEDLTK